jgi:peptide/nickel transport system permease protein
VDGSPTDLGMTGAPLVPGAPGAAPLDHVSGAGGFLTRWYRTPAFVLGLLITGSLVAIGVLAPILTPYDPTQQDLANALAPPSPAHPLGTDGFGRDVWARLIYGARVDLFVGFTAVIIPFIVGTLVGLLAGYFGGWTESVAMRSVDVVQAFPFYVLLIALVFALGTGALGIYVAMALVAWVSYARIVRGEVATAKRQEYVLAARAAGFSHARILGRHILPNVITQPIVYAMSDIVVIILGIVTLAYLGVGFPPPTPDWGAMIFDGQPYLTTHPLQSTIPGLAVVLTGLGLSLLGDGLADLLRPE